MRKLQIPLAIIVGFVILSGAYYFTQMQIQKHTETQNMEMEQIEAQYQASQQQWQNQIQQQLDSVRKAVAPTPQEIQEQLQQTIEATSLQKPVSIGEQAKMLTATKKEVAEYQTLLESRQRTAEQIHNQLFGTSTP